MAKRPSDVLYGNTKPAAETDEGQARLDAYYLALGRFVHRFTLAELAAHAALAHHAKLIDPVSRALLSGVRVDATGNYLSRLHLVKQISDDNWNDLKSLFDQLGIINKFRNDIIHHGAAFVAEGRGIVSNAAKALTDERITKFQVSPEILDDMTADLRQIFARLHTRHTGRPILKGKHPELEKLLQAPWRYKQQPTPPPQSQKPSSRARTKPQVPRAPQK